MMETISTIFHLPYVPFTLPTVLQLHQRNILAGVKLNLATELPKGKFKMENV